MIRTVLLMLFGALLAVAVVSPVPAQELSPGTSSMAEVIRVAVSEAGGDAERERCAYMLAVNMSANIGNGLAGQRTRREIRGLMNGFFLDGEAITVRPFQLEMETGKTLTFSAARRKEIYNEVDFLAQRRGAASGGSDIELAKYEVLRWMEKEPGTAVGLLFTNHDDSQEGASGTRRWTDDPANIAALQGLEQRLRVTWKKQFLAAERPGGRLTAWVYLAARRGAAPAAASPGGRLAAVRRQNEQTEMVAPPEMTAVRLRKDAIRKSGANRLHLAWLTPDYPHDGFDILIRPQGSRKVERSLPATGQSREVELPRTGLRYAVTVAAVRGEARERGAESEPVTLTSTPPPPAPVGGLIALAVLAAAGVIAAVLILRPVEVQVEGQKRVLRPGNPAFAVVPAGFSARRPQDVELPSLYTLPGDQAVASIRRELLGAVVVASAGRNTLQAGGKRVRETRLQPGLQSVQVLTGEGSSPLVLKIQLGSARRPAGGAQGAARPGTPPTRPSGRR